jgi:DNA-directed RNA polymerase beta subunit/intein/homing endonuclease
MSNTQVEINKLIELYFNQPNILYEHLFASYHQFVSEIIPYSLIQEANYFYENVDKEFIYLHGFKCLNIRIKPSTFENDNEIKFPSDARKNHLNYFATVVADIQQFVEKINSLTNDKTIKMIGDIDKETPIANIPIMVKSKYCSTVIKQDLKKECKYDPGGYFIVNGGEKIIMSMEKMIDNKILVFAKKDSSYENGFIYTAQINSKKNEWSDNLQILSIKNRKDGVLTVSISSQLVEIPLIILLRALGIESDFQLITYITYNTEDTKILNMIRTSIMNCVDDNNNPIKTKEEAINYLITRLKRNKRITSYDENIALVQKKMYLDKIFRQDLLPHLGEDIPKKIVFLGFMANKLLSVMLGRNEIDDRDALQNKRIEPPGILLGQLFRQNWKKMLNEIGKHFKKKNQSDDTPINVIGQIKPTTIEQGLKTALSTGVWGMNKTKKGVAQTLQRLSWVQGISYLRRILSPSMEDSTAKVTSIRHVNTNQVQLLCCLTSESEVLMSNRMEHKKIINIHDGDSVSTVNLTTLYEEPSRIYNKFSKMSEKLYEIKTNSGRIIKATNDHPFLVYENNEFIMKKVSELDITTDKLVIRHTEKMIEPEDTIVIIKESDVLLYTSELLSYIDKPISYDKLVILARLLGAINSNALFLVDDEYDVNTLCDDISKLSLGNPLIKRNKDKWEISMNGAFNYLLNLLDCNKTWIEGNKLFKREFLSAFQGINGYVISNQKNIISKINKSEDSIKYMNKISNMFKDFDINTQVKESDTIELVFDNNISNIIKYADWIGYRYSEIKRKMSLSIIEYMKCTLLNSTLSFDEFKDNILPTGDISIGIKYIKLIPNEIVYDFTTISNNHSFIANSFVVSNCTETPEGAKIGIVKSLAMMSSITSQNSSQYDIIVALLKKDSNIKHPFDIDPLLMNQYVKIFINGNWYGVVKIEHSQNIYEKLKLSRRENIIDKYTSILFDYTNKEIRLFYDGGRLIRPILIVSNNKLNINPEVIKDIDSELNLKNKTKSWKTIINKYNNLIEYEDIETLNYLMVADTFTKLTESLEAKTKVIDYTNTTKINRYGDYRWIDYSHCDFHSWVMLGSVAANIPFSDHNYANRNILLFSQAKQSIGIYLSSYKDRMDISQVLYHPQRPLVSTEAMKYNGCLDLPFGENAVVAICSYTGYNQEDSIIFNQSSIDRGIFRADTLKKYHSEISKNPSTTQDDVFTKPDRNKVTGMKQGNYDKLNDKGYVPEETIVENEDILIGKISPIQPTGNNNKVYKDNSEIFKTHVQGVIDRVHTGIYNNEGYEMYNVRVRMERKPIMGDKFTTFSGQKGTIGIAYPQKDMPFTESGIVPDLILNPHGFPSRMSLGHFFECLSSKEAAESGHFVDGTPFNNYDISNIQEGLEKLGYSPYGTETMYCGITGRKMDAEIFIGPVFNIRLKHMVLDKVHGRARGPKQALTRQPLEGRSREGGLKIGEMEKDAMIAHGMGQFLKERMMETSDISKVYICDECGMFASKVIDKDYYRCKGCKNTTKISAIVIPHACKLLFQELTSVNILPRIRVEHNIYSDEV